MVGSRLGGVEVGELRELCETNTKQVETKWAFLVKVLGSMMVGDHF